MLDLGITIQEKTVSFEDAYIEFLEANQELNNFINNVKIAGKAKLTHSAECIHFAENLLGVSLEVYLNDLEKEMTRVHENSIEKWEQLNKSAEGKINKFKELCKQDKKFKSMMLKDSRINDGKPTSISDILDILLNDIRSFGSLINMYKNPNKLKESLKVRNNWLGTRQEVMKRGKFIKAMMDRLDALRLIHCR